MNRLIIVGVGRERDIRIMCVTNLDKGSEDTFGVMEPMIQGSVSSLKQVGSCIDVDGAIVL